MSTDLRHSPGCSNSSFKERFILSFHSVWFASVMGCGISSNLLYKFPYPLRWLEVLGIIMFVVTVLLFLLYNIIFILKNFVFYRDWSFVRDVKQLVFLGCYPMGFSTIINGINFFTNDDDLRWFRFVYVLFWFDVVISVLCAWGVTFCIFWKMQIADYMKHGLNATVMLPLTTMTVAASTGGTIFGKIPEHLQQFHLILCFMLWANTVMLAIPYLVIYFAKLYITKLPPAPIIFSTFIPVGLMGQAAFGLILFGRCSLIYLTRHGEKFIQLFNLDGPISILTTPVQVFAILVSLMLLSFGYFLTFLGVSSVLSAGLHQKFSKNWWAMTFPLGTMANGNAKLGEFYALKFFKVMGTIYAVCTVLITVTCLFGSVLVEFPHGWGHDKHCIKRDAEGPQQMELEV